MPNFRGKPRTTIQAQLNAHSDPGTPSTTASPISTSPAISGASTAANFASIIAPTVQDASDHASLRSTSSSYPSSSFASHWNADSGATSHMTPHRHWLLNYTPKCVPVRLANNTIVYSAGVGSVVFHPVIEGKRVRSCGTHESTSCS